MALATAKPMNKTIANGVELTVKELASVTGD